MAILQAVLQKFSRKPAGEVIQSARLLADKIDRYTPLFELMESRQLLEVTSDRTGETYQTMILAIDLECDVLELDELFPQPASYIYQPGDVFTVKHHHQGQILSFSTPLDSILMSLHNPVYRIRLPGRVSYRQRRQQPRIELSRQQPLTVRLSSPNRAPWYATASNLSAGGMRLAVGGNIADQLSRDCILPRCEFSLHDQLKIRCQAQVKAFRFQRRPYRHTEISIAFLDLAPQQAAQLQQLVHSLLHGAVAA